MGKMNKMRVAIYIRVSTDEQVDGFSLSAQEYDTCTIVLLLGCFLSLLLTHSATTAGGVSQLNRLRPGSMCMRRLSIGIGLSSSMYRYGRSVNFAMSDFSKDADMTTSLLQARIRSLRFLGGVMG